MADGTTTARRGRTRSNATRTPEAEAPAPEETSGETTTEEVEVAKPTTPEEKRNHLAASVKDEHLRIVDAKGKDVKDPSSVFVEWYDGAIGIAKKISGAVKRVEGLSGDLADYCIQMRQQIINPTTGLPDWGGATAAYKQAMEWIIDESQGPEEARTTARNRLQSRVRARLNNAVVAYVRENNSDLKVTDEQVATALKAESGARKSKDDDVLHLIALVDEQFRVGDHAENEPYSPFEEKKGRAAPGTPSAQEQKGIEERNIVTKLMTAIKSVPLDTVMPSLVQTAQQFHTLVLPSKGSKSQPHYGETTRDKVSEQCYTIASIFYATGKMLAEQKLTKEETDDLNAGLLVKFK